MRPYCPTSCRARRSSADVFADAACNEEEEGGSSSGVRGRGCEVLLNPGDVLYVPSYWWHHVHSVTEECVSIAIWFFNERLPLALKGGANGNEKRKYPIPLTLTREQLLAQGRYRSSTLA